MTKKVLDQAMFNVIDTLTELTDDVFNNDDLNNELNDRLKQDLSSDFGGHDLLSEDQQTAIGKNAKEYQKLTTPNLEDNASNSNLSLLDHALTDEEIVKYLSLFSENDFQLVDDLDIENTLQPCSSINSNATTVSTQETNEFRESLLSSDLNCGNHGDSIHPSRTNVAGQFNESKVFESSQSPSNYQTIGESQTVTNCGDQVKTNSTSPMAYSAKSDFDKMNNKSNEINGCQMNNTQMSNNQMANNQINNQMSNHMNSSTQQTSSNDTLQQSNQNSLLRNGLIVDHLSEYGNAQMNYYYPPANSNQQMNQFQATMQPPPAASSQMSFMNNNANALMQSNNCLPQQQPPNNLMDNYCDLANCSSFTPNAPPPPPNYLANNEYFTYTECRDVNCPYTYCSRYNPYYSNNILSMRNQFSRAAPPSFTDSFLTDTSINMNLVDNQIVFNKQSDHLFTNTNTASTNTTQNQTNTKTTKRAKRKQPKSEYTETVICNESTDYAFYTLEENIQFKPFKKRGRKRKTDVLELS